MSCWSVHLTGCCPSCQGTLPPSPGDPCFPRGAWDWWPVRLMLLISAAASSPRGSKGLLQRRCSTAPIHGAKLLIDRSGEMNEAFPTAPADHSNFHAFTRCSASPHQVGACLYNSPPPTGPQPSPAPPNHSLLRQSNNRAWSRCFVVRLTSAPSSYLCL